MLQKRPVPTRNLAITYAQSSWSAQHQLPPTCEAGTIVAERFRMLRELTGGAMGSVWLAYDIRLETSCALKLIHTSLAERHDIRVRFEREAKTAAQLRSSHVVQILDYGVWHELQYIAMELLEGETLQARLDRCGRLPPEQTVRIVAHVARALTKAHAAGLVHRDLTPNNIFLVPEDDNEIAKVLDFGIVKSHLPLLAGNVTQAGVLMGTPLYMSPEQAQGLSRVDYRSDLWSLAVIAFRCVTGRLPFEFEALGELLLQIVIGDVPKPSAIAPSVPPTFDVWWARAAVRDPDRRFQSAKELADALAVALGVSVTPSPRPTPSSPASQTAPPPFVFPLGGAPECPLTEVPSPPRRRPEGGGALANGVLAPEIDGISTSMPRSSDRARWRALEICAALALLITAAVLTLQGGLYIERLLASRAKLTEAHEISQNVPPAPRPAAPPAPAAGPPELPAPATTANPSSNP